MIFVGFRSPGDHQLDVENIACVIGFFLQSQLLVGSGFFHSVGKVFRSQGCFLYFEVSEFSGATKDLFVVTQFGDRSDS